MRLDGAVVGITGGAQGLGLAMAAELGTQGARIALFDRDEEIMQTRRAGKAGLKRRIEHACALPQEVAGLCMGQRGLILFRADARPAGKFALEVVRRQPDRAGTFGKVRPVTPGITEMRQRIGHTGIGNRTFREGGQRLRHGQSLARPRALFHPFLAARAPKAV